MIVTAIHCAQRLYESRALYICAVEGGLHTFYILSSFRDELERRIERASYAVCVCVCVCVCVFRI